MNSDALDNFKKHRRSDCITYEDFDKKYGVNTFGPIRPARDGSGIMVPEILDNSNKFSNSNGFQNTALPQIDIVNNYLKENFDISKYNFVDFGSGKGKILFYNQINNIGYKSLIGLEIDPELYQISLENAIKIPGPKFYNIDATKYELPDEPTIIFVFNSFPINIWKDYLSNLNFNNDLIIVSIHGFGESNPYTLVVLEEPELSNGFTKIYEQDLIYFYKKS